MRFRINQKTLSEAASTVARACNRNGTTAGILVRCDEGVIDLIGVSYEVSARWRIEDADDIVDGIAMIQAQRLAQVAAILPAGEVVQVVRAENGTSLILSSGRSTFTIDGWDADGFPDPFAELDQAATTVVDGGDFLRALGHLGEFTSKAENLPALQAINVFAAKNGVGAFAAATDGSTLARAFFPSLKLEVGRPWQIRPLAAALIAGAGAGQKRVIVAQDVRDLFFVVGALTVVSRQTEERFPDVDRVIPDVTDRRQYQEIRFASEAFATALRRCTVAKAEEGLVKMSGGGGLISDEVRMTAIDAFGKSEDACATQGRILHAFEIGVSAKFLSRMLTTVGKGEVTFYAPIDAFAPMRFFGATAIDVVIMPMRF